jgi:hypothetical protein
MPEVFDGERIRPVQHPVDSPAETLADREVTLSPMLLLGVALGLVLLCGLCFWLGYVIGGHSHNSSINDPQSTAGALSAGSTAKPSAATAGVYQPQSSASSPAPADATDTPADTQAPDAAQPAAAPAGQPASTSDK